MGFRYYRRVNLGNGWGLNLNKTGISTSRRTKWGSFGPNGFSMRTGIKGLTYRSGSGKDGGAFWLLILLIISGFIIVYYVIKYIILLAATIYSSIFKKDGVNYINLIISLSCLFVTLLIVYVLLHEKTYHEVKGDNSLFKTQVNQNQSSHPKKRNKLKVSTDQKIENTNDTITKNYTDIEKIENDTLIYSERKTTIEVNDSILKSKETDMTIDTTKMIKRAENKLLKKRKRKKQQN